MTTPADLIVLLDKVAKNEFAALETLYNTTSPKLFGVAMRIMNNREQAEDVLQESFVKIWRSSSSYRNGASAPMTWLTTIVRNQCFDALRQRGSDNVVEISKDIGYDRQADAMISSADETQVHSDPSDLIEHEDSKKHLSGCLQRLEGAHRQAIALAFFHDLSHTEVAQCLAIPTGTVKSWIRRGLEKLRTCLARLESL